VNLSLWDTAGQEDYARLRPLSYANTNIFLICFSLDSRASLKNVKQKWIPELHKYDKTHHNKQGRPKFILVGNKADLWEKMDNSSSDYITQNEVRSFSVFFFRSSSLTLKLSFKQIDQIVKAEKYIKAFVKCSALSGQGVKEVFDKAISIALEEPAQSGSFCSIL
jgi:small GTP-binding protein